jgi:signal transduction histidine kinase
MGLGTLEDSQKEPFEDAKETVSKSLSEIRSLSKVINGEVMAQWRLYDAIEEEVKRLNKSGVISVKYIISGTVFPILQKEKIIIFRIIQECCSNVIKHAQATELELNANYSEAGLEISIRDNGVGFDMDHAVKGSGLINMQSRAKLIDAQLIFHSAPGEGTTIILKYFPENDSM